MYYTCPACESRNKLDQIFRSKNTFADPVPILLMSKIINIRNTLKKPTENVVLDIGQKGIIDNTEYTVTGIIIRKYGTSIFGENII
jgi:hypothetical protein